MIFLIQLDEQLCLKKYVKRSRSTLAAGVAGVAKRTAQTAPNGAMVIESPFGAKI